MDITKQNGERSLVFVYNADSGLFNLLSDIAKKSFQGEGTCSLCDLTHNPLKVKKEWQEFVESLPIKAEFDYKDLFLKKHPGLSDTEFPAVFIKTADTLEKVVTAKEINATANLSELKDTIEEVFSNLLT